MPSSTAARVALRASSTRAFFSFISVSVAAPTWITATPPTSFARRSCSFSRSYSEVVSSICARSCFTPPEILEGHSLQLDSGLLGDQLRAGQDGDVLQHGLAAITVARRLHRRHVQG